MKPSRCKYWVRSTSSLTKVTQARRAGEDEARSAPRKSGPRNCGSPSPGVIAECMSPTAAPNLWVLFCGLANPYDYGVDGGGEFRPYAFVVTLRCSLDLLRAQELSEISRATK